MVDMGASRVELQIDRAPSIAVELKRTDSLFPTVGVIQRLENQVKRLPEEVVKLEQKINEARQEYRDAATALRQPFKYSEALEVAKWEVERITRTMNGEENPQPTLDPELQAHRRQMRAEFPQHARNVLPPRGPQSGSPQSPNHRPPQERKNRGEEIER